MHWLIVHTLPLDLSESSSDEEMEEPEGNPEIEHPDDNGQVQEPQQARAPKRKQKPGKDK